jgi:hypothetical protein
MCVYYSLKDPLVRVTIKGNEILREVSAWGGHNPKTGRGFFQCPLYTAHFTTCCRILRGWALVESRAFKAKISSQHTGDPWGHQRQKNGENMAMDYLTCPQMLAFRAVYLGVLFQPTWVLLSYHNTAGFSQGSWEYSKYYSSSLTLFKIYSNWDENQNARFIW